MSHSRLWSGLLVGTGLLLTVSATPAQAFTNPFTGIADKAKTQLTKVYLMLPGDKPGKAVLQASVKTTDQLKTMDYGADMKVTVLDVDNQELATADFNFAGPMKLVDSQNPALTQQDVALKGEVAIQGVVLRASADMKVDGATYYFKIRELPPFADFSAIKNKWLKVSNPMMAALVKEEKTPAEKQAAEVAWKQLLDDSQVSEAKKATVDGNKVFLVDVTVPPAALQKYFEAMEKFSNAEATTTKYLTDMGIDPTTPEFTQAMAKSKADRAEGMQKFFAATKPMIVTFTVDQKSLFMRKLDLPLEIDLASFIPAEAKAQLPQTSPVGDLSKIKTLKINFTMIVNKFNQPVDFTVPTDAVDFETAMKETTANAYPTAPNPAKSRTLPIAR